MSVERWFPAQAAAAAPDAASPRGARGPASPDAASLRGARGRADPGAAEKRLRQREERVTAGLAELGRWLEDQVQQGLAGAERAGPQPFAAMAARLVDAQAPAAATAVRALGGIAGTGAHWADRLLGELAMLRLLVAGWERRGDLPGDLAATLRSRIGFTVAAGEVLATGPVRDHWQVLGRDDTDDGMIVTRRTWLLGARGGRFALHLAFAAPGQTLAADLVPGTSFDADLCYHPGALPLRALIKDRTGPPRPLTDPVGAVSLRAALDRWSSALAAEPWRTGLPVLLDGVVPSADGHLTDAAGDALPLLAGHRDPWWLLAAAGGRPATVAAEWTPEGLLPLAAWRDGRFVPAAAPVPGGRVRRLPELPPELLATALVGTGRRPFSAAALTRVLPALSAAASDLSLLEAAAVALAYARAGATVAAGHPSVAAAPPEEGRPVPGAAGARLLLLLGDGAVPGGTQQAQELLTQWLTAAVAHGGHVPPESLPRLLDAGRRNSMIRPAIGRVAGARGRWLATLRSEWSWLRDEAPGAATAEDPEIWETGTTGERLAFLTRLRADDPALGLALLRGAWESEAPGDRARLLGALGTGLSPADDGFLEGALDDRRREVREAALELLQRLPGSGLSRRMAARARAAVRLDRTGAVVVVPPEELTGELRRDGIAAQPARGSGVQAWLLEEIVAGAPLAIWIAGLAPTPAAVVTLAAGTDWEVPLLHGWAKAAVAQRDPGWATALVRHDGGEQPALLREAVRWDLHLLLPPAELARVAAGFLRREDHLAHRLLAVHPGPWPDELAGAVLETITQRARTDKHSWQLAELCRAAAPAMPPRHAPLLTRLAAELDRDRADPARIRAITELARVLTFRHEMLQEFE